MNSGTPIYKYPAYWLHSVVNSYAVVFFSSSPLFGVLLIIASLLNPVAGCCGLLGALLAIGFATAGGLNRDHIQKGYYGYDAMLVCCALGTYYNMNAGLLMLIFCTAALAVLCSVATGTVLLKYQLPALSFPFLFTVWVVLVSARAIPSLSMVQASPSLLSYLLDKGLVLPALPANYFRSLSSLFFQSSVTGGILIALGLVLYSRIAFTLSLIGFLSAYYCYYLFGNQPETLYANFAGLNFIFQAIAIGGFFLVPSAASYATVIVLTPPLIVLVLALNRLLYPLGILAYSLPFSLLTILFLFLLKGRSHHRYLHPVGEQTFSPESNLYNHLNMNRRLAQFNATPIHVPFWGEWMVSQGHDGTITHLGDWSKAFDFIVLDEEMKSYRQPGMKLQDFYCYEKPVMACADGYVVTVVDHVEDNVVKDVNTAENWGNSIVIQHSETLYSQVSHLKKGTLRVKPGDHVHRGDIIAMCGNSGRSPEPHIHFQLQTSPAVGAPTLDHPLAYYLVRSKSSWQLKTMDKPKEGELVNSVQPNSLLKTAFHFIPGTRLRFRVNDGNKETTVNWEVFTDSYNQTYLFCHATKAAAYFYNDGSLLCFTTFYGDHKSLLYHFYLAHYKVLLGFYKGLEIKETYPLATIRNKVLHFFHDIIAPFYQAVKTEYTLLYSYIDDVNITSRIHLNSLAEIKVAGYSRRAFTFETVLNENRISEFIVKTKTRTIKAVCETV